jgi:PAS domain S-box-containing protein
MWQLMERSFTKKFLLKYRDLVHKSTGVNDPNYKRSDIAYWKDILFLSLLEYALPICLITVIPGLFLLNEGPSVKAISIGIFVLLVITTVTFLKGLELHWRKFIMVSLLYLLSVYYISSLGYIGPGIFYLLSMTVLIALILPIRYAYLSIVLNLIILLTFASINWIQPHNWSLPVLYHAKQWVTLGISLLIVELMIVLLIDKIFDRLQITIYKKDRLRDNYTRIFDSSPIPMWLFDIDTLKFLAVNNAAVQQYGYSKEEFLASNIQILRPQELQQEIQELVAMNKDQFSFRKNEVLHLTKTGDKLYVNIESRLMSYKGSNAKLVLATNITAQVKAERENNESILKIKQSEANLQAIFNSTGEGFVLLDDTYHIISFNEKALVARFLNKNHHAFELGHSIFDYVDDFRKGPLREYLRQVDEGLTVEYELEFEVDGKSLWMHYTIMPVQQESLKKGICINGRDITAFKRYVQTIEAQNAKLRDISWTQSHMVRGPLARIMGLNSLIRNSSDLQEQHELLHFLELSCNDLDTVVRKIVKDSENQNLG